MFVEIKIGIQIQRKHETHFEHRQYIPRNVHTVFALLCFVVVIHRLIFPYPSGLLHWHCGNLTIAPVPAKQPWWIWINTSCEFIMNDCITTTKQSTTKPCAYFLGYTVCVSWNRPSASNNDDNVVYKILIYYINKCNIFFNKKWTSLHAKLLITILNNIFLYTIFLLLYTKKPNCQCVKQDKMCK